MPDRHGGADAGPAGDGGEAPDPADTITLEEAERRRQMRAQARHQEGLALLESAGITGPAIPAGFDGAALMDELEERRDWHDAWRGPDHDARQTLTADHRKVGDAVFDGAEALAKALRSLLSISAGRSGWVPHRDEEGQNVPVADVIRWALNNPRQDAAAQGAAPDYTPSRASLRQILCDVENLAAARARAAERWKVQLPTPSAASLLCGFWLPAIYERTMKGRTCVVQLRDGVASEGLRFLVAAMKYCGRVKANNQNVEKLYWRYQATRWKYPGIAEPLRMFCRFGRGCWRMELPVSALF